MIEPYFVSSNQVIDHILLDVNYIKSETRM